MSKKIKIKSDAVLTFKKSSAKHIKVLKQAFKDGSLGNLLFELKTFPKNTVPVLDTERLKESRILKAIYECLYITDADGDMRMTVISGYRTGKHALAKNVCFNLLALDTYKIEGSTVWMSKNYKWVVAMPDGTEKELRELAME